MQIKETIDRLFDYLAPTSEVEGRLLTAQISQVAKASRPLLYAAMLFSLYVAISGVETFGFLAVSLALLFLYR